MKTEKIRGRLVDVLYRGVSYWGNPHATIKVETEDGNVIFGKTAMNAGIGYAFENHRGQFCEWHFHETRNGNVVFDWVEC